jgi:hypothetical protein
MFTTYILICSMSVANECMELRDTRGPYDTQAECKARAVEMAEDMQQLFTVPHSYSYKCKADEYYEQSV